VYFLNKLDYSRTMQLSCLLFCLYASVSMRVQAQPAGELLLLSPPSGWQVVPQDREGNVVTLLYVPPGQNIESWRELVTIRSMPRREDADPETALGGIVKRAEETCQKLLEVRKIPFTQESAYPTLGLIQGCGRSRATSRGEFTIVRAIAGKENLFVIEKSWRLPAWKTSEMPEGIDDDEIMQWLDYLASARVCDSREMRCRAQTATN
jgi:hypothetical protein